MTKAIDKALIDKILEVPYANLIIEEVNTALQLEQEKRLEFYNQITEQDKAEFINGQIILHSPVVKKHNEVSNNINKILDAFVFKNKLGFVGFEKILIQLTRNDYEPDICFFNRQKADNFTDDQKLFPIPDLIVEVLSESTKDRDRGIKFTDYEAHEVSEYWIVDPMTDTLEQYLYQEGKYELNIKSGNGIVTCMALSGLSFPIECIFSREMAYELISSILK